MGVLILACDPGGKPGYCLLDTSTCVPRKYMHRGLPPLPVVRGLWPCRPEPCPALAPGDACCTELQWLYSLQKRAAILTLAPRAGWQLAVLCLLSGGTPHAQLPQDWRAALQVPSGTAKEIVGARVERSLLPAERALALATRLTPKRLLDCYDAIAIGWADYLQPRPWEIPP